MQVKYIVCPHSGERINLYGLGDIHFGSPQCDVEKLRKDIKKIMKDPDGKVLLMGDLIDSIIPGDKRYRNGAVAGAVDDIIDNDISGLLLILGAIRTKIIGVLTGNHEDKITQCHGTNPGKRIAEKLGAPFLGYTTLLRLDCRGPLGSRLVDVFASHGHGGSTKTVGGSLSSFDRSRSAIDADLYLFGHVHRRQATKEVQLCWGNAKQVAFRTKMIGITGTYLKTFGDGVTPSYSEIKGYHPTSLGCLCVSIEPRKIGFDLHAEI